MNSVKAYIMLGMILFSSCLAAKNIDDPLNRKITFQSDSILKSELLDTLEVLANVYFSYNPQLVGAMEKITLNYQQTELSTILSALINPETVAFKSIDNQIIFFSLDTISKENVNPPDFMLVRGFISEGRKKEPVPYCNISISGYSIGTISNMEGRFTLKIPPEHYQDTLRFSSLGYLNRYQPISLLDTSFLNIHLLSTSIQLKSIDVIHYNPIDVLDSLTNRITINYETEYALYTTFYREVIKQNNAYTDVSEAVVEVMKAPYDNEFRDDNVKFIKGRKSSEVTPFDKVKLKLKGGPYYITKLDVMKNVASFINPEHRHLYTYSFNKITLLNDRETVIIDFEPVGILRDMLYEGRLYIDRETWALARIEFNLTRQGLVEARNQLIEKEPKKLKAIPVRLEYVVCYKQIGDKWYLLSAKSDFNIKIIDRKKRQRTHFYSCSEILTTKIEKGDFKHFSRREIFKPNEFITEKIEQYDKPYWEDYNIIEPEDDLSKAIRNFDTFNLQNQNNTLTNPEPK